MIDKSRLCAITDGIIAVAATVMVLRLDLPDRLSAAVVQERLPTLVAYVISFTQIFLAWHENHDSMAHAVKINHRVFLMNTLWLFLITLLPFVTGVIGKSPDHTPTVLLYLAVLSLQQLAQMAESKMVEALNQTAMQDAEIIRRIWWINYAAYAVAAATAFFRPFLSILIVVASSASSVVLICLYDRRMDPAA